MLLLDSSLRRKLAIETELSSLQNQEAELISQQRLFQSEIASKEQAVVQVESQRQDLEQVIQVKLAELTVLQQQMSVEEKQLSRQLDAGVAKIKKRATRINALLLELGKEYENLIVEGESIASLWQQLHSNSGRILEPANKSAFYLLADAIGCQILENGQVILEPVSDLKRAGIL